MPYIFIFTGSGGQKHGYKDEWLNEDVFSYSGEGQSGDMKFTKGNLALRDHLVVGKRIFLFEYIASGTVKYVSELHFLDSDYYETEDTSGRLRIGIKFFFKRIGESKYVIPEDLNSSLHLYEPNEPFQIQKPSFTERVGLVTSRVGQGAYRKSILHRWAYQCAATGFKDSRVLIASHIQPWKNSTDQQRLDVDNGILLSPDFDALFDKNLISFNQSGKIIISSSVSDSISNLGITGKETIKNLSEGNKIYLENHKILD